MKVAQINSVCGIRSTGRICTDLAEVLKDQGYECKIAYGRENVPQKYQQYSIRMGNAFSIKIDALKTRLFDNAGFNSNRTTKKLIEWLIEYNPDIIHLHNLHGYYINLKILFEYLKICGKKIVWTLHDCWSFTGHCSNFTFAKCEQWRTHCLSCSQTKEYPKSLFRNNAKNNYQNKKELFTAIPNMTIVTPSHWLASLVRESFLKDYPIQIIPNGIDLSVFKPTDSDLREKFDLQNKKIILGVASAWGKRKGFDDFIRLAQLLKEEYQVVMVGVTAKQKKKLPSNIIAIERTNSVVELAQWYTLADVFFNPTYEDNFPTTNIEAIACGTPIITYPTGGSPEPVIETNGLVTKDFKVEELMKVLPEIFKLDRRKIRETALKYDKMKQYQKYIRIYEKN